MGWLFWIAALVFLKIVLLQRTYRCLPVYELKRRARAHDSGATRIYKVVAVGRALDLLLLILGASSGMILLISSARYAWWLCVIVAAVMAWLLIWAPPARAGGLAWRTSAFTSPYLFKLLSWLNPILNPIARWLPKTAGLHVHAGVYEVEDLLVILQNQAVQADNRINTEDLTIAAGALTFGAKKVSQVMTPRRMMHFVGEDEVVGPTLMDELHKTGFSRFPVVRGPAKAANPHIVGTLYLKDITQISQENKGKVKDLYKKDIFFINEDCSLQQALDAMLKSRHHLLIVVNKFEETVGVISMEDVLEQIMGRPIADEFDSYDNLRAVANMQAEREQAEHKHEIVEPEPPAEPAEEPTPETPAETS